MATEAERSREARRRRIVERGADRLALITGQKQDFVPDTPPASSPEVDPLNAHLFSSSSSSAINENVSSVLSEMRGSFSSGGEPDIAETMIQESEARLDETKSEKATISNGAQASFSSSGDSFGEPHIQKRKQMIAKMVTSAIDKTEKSRLVCTVVLAVLVVIYTRGFSLLGLNYMRSIMLFKPALLVLVSNISLVVARLILNDEKDGERSLKQRAAPSNEGDWIQQVGKALEMGIVLKKTMDALLLDFCVYAIIVVLGISTFE